MEAIMTTTRIAMSHALLDIFASSDDFDGPYLGGRLGSLVQRLNVAEARELPHAYSEVLTLLRSDLLRSRAAADIAVELDMFEVVPALIGCVREFPDVRLSTALATLVGNPAVTPDQREEAGRVIGSGHHIASTTQALRIRLDPRIEPTTDLERVLRAQAWPATARETTMAQLASVVFVTIGSGHEAAHWRLVFALYANQVRVKRVAASARSDSLEAWYRADAPLVVWSGVDVAALREFGLQPRSVVTVTGDAGTALGLQRTVSLIERALPRHRRLPRFPQSVGQGAVLTPGTVKLGAFDLGEMSFLGAASRSVVSKSAKGALIPRELDVHRWNFGQLIALRIVQAFKAKRLRLLPDAGAVLAQIGRLAEAAETSRVAIDAAGQVFVFESGDWRSLSNGQIASEELLSVDEAFEPLEIGNGRYPSLLTPTQSLVVHPETLGGTPTLVGRRLAAKAIATVHRERGPNVVRSAFPELSPAEIAQAVSVGSQILTSR
jgi:uncharacterized protein (DUF433 family)